MRTQVTPATHMMYLKAFGSAPCSFCPRDRRQAVAMMTPILANSDGWKGTPKNFTQRPASLVFSMTRMLPMCRSSKTSSSTRKMPATGSSIFGSIR